MIGARKGIVVAVHPSDNSVDLVMADDGSRLIGVAVMSADASVRSGSVNLPYIPPRPNKWDISQRDGNDVEAVVGYVGRNPVVQGFLFPQINQMLVKTPGVKRFRHPSDVEFLIDMDGNIQLSHPNGTYIRIGENPDFDDIAKQVADSSKTDRNTEKKVNVRVGMAGGAAVLTIAPDGAVKLTTQTTLDLESQGDMNFKSGTRVRITAPRIDWND